MLVRGASFGGSNQLAQQARQGFPFDVFLSASPVYTRRSLANEGVVRAPVAFATNSLVIIVPRSEPGQARPHPSTTWPGDRS